MFLPFAINNVTMSNFHPVWPIFFQSDAGFRSDDFDAEPWIIIDLGVERIITSINLMQAGESSFFRGYVFFNLSLFYAALGTANSGIFLHIPTNVGGGGYFWEKVTFYFLVS